ncbi:hypothetical protein BFJ63_vAg13445 [Fusarium oxysporum f. sp. narcissi]|uniref:Uncharacterized protein n=2 Tax=Fusarium oxysporum TaxID=5507 RepID=A0A4Q2VGN4_FUSOX|nr:hypothetical protein BFJ65_g17903 [Fusarium oxysporum f. sp. cepae]RKK37204.1 hypothetical protein BFJ67_g12471 [Fusarium oxysporum f. sp. cepae]RKK40180.1 hypothetical protein BFJ66_g11618 [Fusarium oxysporum f. sp. cepae]RYC83693.1 hypothetical protein BFJ63_vAg13445 [Fusarium oxysporum f. sp. narcissi]
MNSTFESQDKIYNTGLNFPTTAILTGPSTAALHKAFNLMAKVRSSIILLLSYMRCEEADNESAGGIRSVKSTFAN